MFQRVADSQTLERPGRRTHDRHRRTPINILRAARCDNENAALMFCCYFFLFYSPRDLRGLSTDRRETLPHDRKLVQF